MCACVCVYIHTYIHVCPVSSVMSDSLQPKDFSLPGSSVCGILQARILEWVAMPLSRGSSWPSNWMQFLLCLLHCRWILYHWATGKAYTHTHTHTHTHTLYTWNIVNQWYFGGKKQWLLLGTLSLTCLFWGKPAVLWTVLEKGWTLRSESNE